MTLQTAMREASENNKVKNLFENNICLVVSFSAWGINRKADIDKVETPADKDSLKLQKKLLKSKAYDKIMSYRNEIKAFLQRFSVASPALRPAAHLVKLENVQFVDEQLQKMIEQDKANVEAFGVEYNEAIEQASINLADQFRASQYPPFNQVQAEFCITVSYMSFSTPESLKKIKASLFKREADKVENTMREVTANIELLLVAEFQSVIDKALENLRPNRVEGAKKKVFRTEWIEKLNGLVDSLRARNLTENVELYELGDRVKAVMNDVNEEELKRMKEWRTDLAAQFDEIKKTMGEMLITKPSREYSF